ncbi:DUF4349 domain-containing protein [Georgenia sp. 311]|uniref:DUF4349 domain-containing protein n=1 Tax=Georgenia sp. 311 TaxID=2585134 RepID=UPI00111234BB|nr:DUF4349 domain-containing protein [Georgenia sp. 311]TNC16954.1 DUF4349 domain-containing protein [Georgenia sp. 311]
MRLLRTVALLLVLLLGAVACSGADDSTTGTDSSGDAARAGMASAEDAEEADEAREVVVTGSLTLVADDAQRAMDEIVRIVGQVGGRIQERSEHTAQDGEDVSGALTVRVPAAEVTGTLDAVERLGEVTDVAIGSEDVTRQGRNLDARITALETSTERLLELMEDADSSDQLLAAEAALSERQAELEALQAERAYLSEQVTMSTLHISVTTDHPVRLEAGGFAGGLRGGWDALVTVADGLLVALGAALPWLLVLGLPVTAVVLARRRRRRPAVPPAEPAATA